VKRGGHITSAVTTHGQRAYIAILCAQVKIQRDVTDLLLIVNLVCFWKLMEIFEITARSSRRHEMTH
jgi:hypothetical protein